MRFTAADYILVFSSNAITSFSLPELVAGPLAIVVVYEVCKSDEMYPWRTRMGDGESLAKMLYLFGVVAVVVSFLYVFLLAVQCFGAPSGNKVGTTLLRQFGLGEEAGLGWLLARRQWTLMMLSVSLAWANCFFAVAMEGVLFAGVFALTKRFAISLAVVLGVFLLCSKLICLAQVCGFGVHFFLDGYFANPVFALLVSFGCTFGGSWLYRRES
ncbi:hypothetical protein [Adlercreutzia aquisgranensis]|uniref:hypothetical protein n=1 Tax=Adlercreutzia aquisgranensis TaxID=2941323 RepID=UPI002040933D|nr:hypothetical protein [Adlercreutzia aquisgranensis]